MDKKEKDLIAYCLNEMIEGHYRVMCALYNLKSHIEGNGESAKPDAH
jgi:hypothetical protein